MGNIDSSLKKLRKEEIRKVFEQRHSLKWKASTKFPKIPNGNLNILQVQVIKFTHFSSMSRSFFDPVCNKRRYL